MDVLTEMRPSCSTLRFLTITPPCRYYTQLLKLCVVVLAVSGRSLEFTLAKALF